jgi:hypothetical protein
MPLLDDNVSSVQYTPHKSRHVHAINEFHGSGPSICVNTPLAQIIIPKLNAQQTINNTLYIQMDPFIKSSQYCS